MNKLLTNASNLSRLFMSRAQLKADIQATEEEVTLQELALTPFDGWTGKNEGERTTSKMRALAADPEHCKLKSILRGFQVDLGKVLAEIDGINADTSALEFTIRDETNRVMGGKSILDVLQDGEIEQLENDGVSEQEMLEQAEERAAMEGQPTLDFEPGSVNDPESENYIPF